MVDAFACPVCQGALQELDENSHQCLNCKHICTLLEEKRIVGCRLFAGLILVVVIFHLLVSCAAARSQESV